MSGERLFLTADEAKFGSLAEKHAALNDVPGPKSGRFSVLNKIENYLIEAGRVDKQELRRKTPFFSRDQREHIIQEVRANWALRESRIVEGYQVVSYVREGRKNITLQTSYRSLKTGRFEKYKEQDFE